MIILVLVAEFDTRFWAQILVAGFGHERIWAHAHFSASDLFVLPKCGPG